MSLLDCFSDEARPLVHGWFEAAVQRFPATAVDDTLQWLLKEAQRAAVIGLCGGDGRARDARNILRELVAKSPAEVIFYAHSVRAHPGEMP
jgi:predicted polyphosphate/ATP-dependent NAD kinase